MDSVLSLEDRNSAKSKLHKGWAVGSIFLDVRTSSYDTLRGRGGKQHLWAWYATPVKCGPPINVRDTMKRARYVSLADPSAITGLCAKFGITMQGPSQESEDYHRVMDILAKGIIIFLIGQENNC